MSILVFINEEPFITEHLILISSSAFFFRDDDESCASTGEEFSFEELLLGLFLVVVGISIVKAPTFGVL